jgi:hypothetical protein
MRSNIGLPFGLLDRPLISLIYSRHHLPAMNMQAGIKLTCNLAAAFIGLTYIICMILTLLSVPKMLTGMKM